MSAIYRIITLGDDATGIPPGVKLKLVEIAKTFGIEDGIQLEFVDGANAAPTTAACVGVFIGATPCPAFAQHALLAAGIPVIPLVSDKKKCSVELPARLQPFNAMSLADDSEDAIAAAMLECLGLLHRQRRVFLSYVRKESPEAALQLFDDLSKRQFDVFLDTHDVRPGEDFQAVLWHRLCDSDVMVMLDTSSYFNRRWTREEYGKASLKKAAILRVAWPGVTAAPSFTATDAISLTAADFDGKSLNDSALDRIGSQIERLRSLSIATRHANLVGTLRAAVDDLRGNMIGIGPHRRVDFDLPRGKRIHAYSVLGVPTSQTLHDVAVQAATGNAAIVYDHLGVHERWLDHLNWLGANFSDVRWLQVARLGWDLTVWDSE
jgi:TIR domain